MTAPVGQHGTMMSCRFLLCLASGLAVITQFAFPLGAASASAGRVLPAAQKAQAQRSAQQARPNPLPGRGEPGVVAATDRAFARAARETGLWSAYRQYAASNAVLHLPDGLVPANQWLAGRTDPTQAPVWSPTAVWTSCDGSLAVTFGRFTDPDGTVGSYAATWVRQSGGYRFVYKLRAADDPQPAPRPPRPALADDPDTIVVPGIGMIDGRVAECLPRGSQLPPPPPDDADDGSGPRISSDDGTLHYRWQHRSDGARRLKVVYLRQGRWETALDFVVPQENRA